MIVEDSCTVREFLSSLVNEDPRLQVVAAVASGEEALSEVHRAVPDVISMDIRMPGLNGLETTQRIMTQRPTPIVVVSASVEAEDLKISMNALRAGALSVIEKPVGRSYRDYAVLAERLCTQLVLMSQVKVVRQRFARELPFCAKNDAARSPGPLAPRPGGPFRVMGLAASTGGPSALQQVLSDLGPDFPIPVLLVQHMTASFIEGFVSWLDGLSPLRVTLAQDGELLRRGRAYVAPADQHLVLHGTTIRLTSDAPISGQRPSATVLFQSLAQSFGPRAIGIVLTGMGDDGAIGLNEVRAAGGYTIAEDESTAVVYGMPGAAARMGAVCELLPLDAIGRRAATLAVDAEVAAR